MTTGSVPLDLRQLCARATRVAQLWRPGTRIVDVVALDGGRSSLTFRARAAPTRDWIVLKVAPPGLEPVRNRDVLRQARLLDALATVPEMKVPAVLFTDIGGASGQPAADPPFFGMSYVHGTSFEPHLTPDLDGASDDEIGGRARHAARLLAVLHQQRAADVGAGGEPVVSLTDEVGRWEQALGTVPDVDPALGRLVVDALRADVPDQQAPCVLHGDFRLGNMLSEGATVNAVIDWEIWGHGDPRTDLGWFLLCADAAAWPTAFRCHAGMPPVDALVHEYVSAGGAPADRLEWFRALALTKMAATTALISKHNRKSGHIELAEQTRLTVAPMLQGALAAL